MPWGQKVPELEWKHFVLPVRVNNENLDDARTVLYEELRDRVRSLSMRDAVLEVNHWCHEHVTYQPSDARTSSPLATMASAIGRCGEESTFCVAALRAVGIPARVVRRDGVRVMSCEEELDQVHLPDPVAQQLCRLEAKTAKLEAELAALREEKAKASDEKEKE